MRKVELLPTRDCEAGYGPARKQYDSRSYLPDLVPSIVCWVQQPCDLLVVIWGGI